MSDDDLTQHQKNLKSIQNSLLEMCEDHQQAQEYFIKSQDQARSAQHRVNQSWTKILELIPWIEEMMDDVTPMPLQVDEVDEVNTIEL